MPDPPRKSLFRRLNFGKKGAVAVAFSAAEELWGPAKHDARIEVAAQHRVGRPAPAPSDPPDLTTSIELRPGTRTGREDLPPDSGSAPARTDR